MFKRNIYTRTISKIMAAVMVLGGLTFGTMPAKETKAATEVRTVNLGADAIKPTAEKWAPQNEQGITVGNRVYFGKYNNAPVMYRVLKEDSGKLLFDCDRILYTKSIKMLTPFGKWSGSTLQTDLKNNFYSKEDVFSDLERNSIVLSHLQAHEATGVSGIAGGVHSYESDDYVFLLSYPEVSALYYGTSTAKVKAGFDNGYWTRSSEATSDGSAVCVTDKYSLVSGQLVRGVSPAFNISTSNIAFTSNISVNHATFAATTAKTSNDWTLALNAGTGFNAAISGSSTVSAGAAITVNVSSNASLSFTNYNNQISAMLVDGSGNVVAYGKVSDVKTGNISVTIPSTISNGTYTLKVFDEAISATAPTSTTSYVSNIKDITVTVNGQATPAEVKPTSISLNKASSDLNVGQTDTLTVTFNPTGVTNKSVTWTSSNTSVATVDSNGKVTAVGAGNASITAKSVADSTKEASCYVTVQAPITGITLSAANLNVTKGNTGELNATVLPANTNELYTVEWISDNTGVVTVNQSGSWNAVGNGTAVITAKVYSNAANRYFEASCTINVTKNLTSISLNKSDLTLNVNGYDTISVTYTPEDTSQNKDVNWTSSNTTVATVDASGKVTAKAPGSATITATAKDNSSITASCNVTVKSPLTAITLNKSSASVEINNTVQLSVASVTPSNTTDAKTVTWSSSNTSVATVNSSGVVTAIAPGNATITATSTANSSLKKTCAITVTSKVTGVSISQTSLTLDKGASETITASVVPSNTTQSKTISWSSSNTSVATVTGGKITAKGKGIATITAKSSANSSILATCTVTVNVPLTGITLNMPSLSLTNGADGTLSVKTFAPTDTTDSKDVTWSSSKTSVATVDSEGKVKAVGVGTATITATSKARSSVKATCTITVTQQTAAEVHLAGISVNPSNVTVEKGKTEQLSVNYSPSNTTDSKDVTWSSSDTNIATVDGTGKVTAKGTGDVIITATSKANSQISAICNVKVISKLTAIALNYKTVTLTPGEIKSLTVSYTPSDTTDDKKITWTSDNTDAVTVDEHGVVTAVAGGKAVITATSSNSSVKATCTVTVASNITGVNISQSELTLEKGAGTSLSANVLPENTTQDKGITWSTSDSNIAEVWGGWVNAKNPGTVVITAASTANPSIKAECTLKVTSKLSKINLNMQEISLTKGASASLAVKSFEPVDTTDNTDVAWTSSNTNVATVNASGAVTAVAEGTAVITATSKANSSIKASCNITVTNQISGDVKLMGISIAPSTVNLEKGNKHSLVVSYSPSNTTDSKNVTWTSDNENVVKVDASGEVTAVGGGSATVTATSTVNSEIKAICKVSVTSKITDITLSDSKISLEKYAGKGLTASVIPSDTTQSKNITWTSSDTNVAQVWGGWVYATGEGTAVITAAASDNLEIKKTCEITVTDSQKQENAGNENQGSGSENQGSGNENQGSGNENQGSGNENQGSGSENQGSGNENQGSGSENQGSGNENSGNGNTNQDSNNEHSETGWYEENGAQFWYEGGVKQGLEGRGKEVYDPVSNAWYWLDAVQGGAKTVSKDVYQESDAGVCADDATTGKGKWVRYDENGHMVKGWSSDGNYYFDLIYGTMVKGYYTIEDIEYFFDVDTGVLKYVTVAGLKNYTGWKNVEGIDVWYENGQRQGYSKDRSYRGKEIYDPASNAWYWLDNVDNGKKAVSKDVYQESLAGDWGDIDKNGEKYGKWVRYDAQGHMIKGWQYTSQGTYYFDLIYGTMAKGKAIIDGKTYTFDPNTGVLQ